MFIGRVVRNWCEPHSAADDMVGRVKELGDFAKKLGRPLRVATMCSGTESPILEGGPLALAPSIPHIQRRKCLGHSSPFNK